MPTFVRMKIRIYLPLLVSCLVWLSVVLSSTGSAYFGTYDRICIHSQIGFVWVLVVGSAVSLAWRQQQPWQRAGREHPDPALFTPPLARRLRAGKKSEVVKPEAAQNSTRL